MPDTKVESETNELLFLDGDEYFYAVDDPSGTPTSSKIASRTTRSMSWWRQERELALWWPASFGNATLSVFGAGPVSVGSTSTGTAFATTNTITRRKRANFDTGAVSGTVAYVRPGSTSIKRGDASGVGGFRFLARFAITTMPASWRSFIGLVPLGSLTPTNVDPSSLLNMVGIGKDAADTAWQIMFNDGSGTASKIALSASDFPVNTTTLLEVELFCPPGASQNITYWARNISGVDANGFDTYSKIVTGTISTDLLSTSGSCWSFWVSNDVNSASAVLTCMRIMSEAFV